MNDDGRLEVGGHLTGRSDGDQCQYLDIGSLAGPAEDLVVFLGEFELVVGCDVPGIDGNEGERGIRQALEKDKRRMLGRSE